ncbi:ASCH domain-containing protein [Roseibium sediminis]|uniref:ASCH domain-containing protein n=1 Tax=Roseibium sediminis TaxID=1775174 RepID=UPI00123C984A|nr:ASCH domain-containing protein [Roseibium sediminis]
MTIDDIKAKYPGAQTFTFGDSKELCDELVSLVRSGKKTASCGALQEFTSTDTPMPIVGRRDISLNWDGTPAFVMETVEVTIRRFCEVDADFALAEGENETLEAWQAGHRAYFERNGGFSEDMELICERFKLIEDLQQGAA